MYVLALECVHSAAISFLLLIVFILLLWLVLRRIYILLVLNLLLVLLVHPLLLLPLVPPPPVSIPFASSATSFSLVSPPSLTRSLLLLLPLGLHLLRSSFFSLPC